MASNTDVGCAASAQTLVFSGVGQVILYPLSGGTYYLGSSTDDHTTGLALSGSVSYSVYVTSPDDLYVYNSSGSSGVVRVYHNR